MPSVNTCCVPGCSEMSASTRILHSFPNPMKDHKRFHTWISNIGAPELAGLTNETIYKCRRVCHAHFERKYWCRYERISKVAIPTLNILHIEDKYNPDVALKSGEAPSFSSFNTREMALCESQLDSALPQIKREVSSPCSEGEVSPEKKPKLEPNGDVYGLNKVFKMGKTNAEKCKSYYYRKKAAKEAEKIRQGLSVKRPTRKTGAERTRACRLRKRMTGILSVPSTSNPPPASVVTNRPDVSTVSSNGVADHDVDTREMALCESQLDSALPQIKREVSSPCSEHRMSPEPNEDIYGLKKVSTTEMALCESQLDSALPRIKREVPSPEESRLSPEMKPKLEPNGDVYGLNKVDTGEMALCESQLDSALPQIKREVSSPCSEDRMSPEPNEDIYGLNKDPPTTSILGSRSQLSPIDNTTINTPSTSKVSEMPSRNAVKCKNYRNRKKSANVKIKKPLTSAERSRMYRLRKKQLAQGIKSSLNEVCTPPTFNSLMTSEQSPQPVTKEHQHLRYNPLKDEWILVSPHRCLRPWSGQTEEPPDDPPPDPNNPLRAGSVRANGKRNPDYTSTYVFPNDFPALLQGIPGPPAPDHPLFQAAPAEGTCRVMCFHPDSAMTIPLMSVEEILAVIDEWVAQLKELGRRFKWVQIFENKGAIMGCSNPHPHCQIWASGFLPNEPRIKDRCQREYYKKHGTNMLADYVQEELKKKERIVIENSEWVALVPYWAAWPYETMVLPKNGRTQRMSDLSAEQKRGLAEIMKHLNTKYDNLFQCSFPYSMGWHGAPTGPCTSSGDSPHWLLHALYLPPLLRSATVRKFMVGYEMLAQPQRDLTPEQAAARLRGCDHLVHYKNRKNAKQ